MMLYDLYRGVGCLLVYILGGFSHEVLTDENEARPFYEDYG